MEEADLGLTTMAMGAEEALGGNLANPADYENLFVRFVLHPKIDQKATKEQGRPIYKDVPYVDVRIPGDRTSHIFRPAGDIDRQRWPKHWQAFLDKKEQPQEGTPLEHWPLITRAMVEELKYFNVRTVEQLAYMNDTSIQNFMGIRVWVDRARAFLAVAKKSKEAEEVAHELAKRDNTIMTLEQQVTELRQMVNELAAEKDPVPPPNLTVAPEEQALATEPEGPDETTEALNALATEDEVEPVAEEASEEETI